MNTHRACVVGFIITVSFFWCCVVWIFVVVVVVVVVVGFDSCMMC